MPSLSFDWHGPLEVSFLGRRLRMARGLSKLASRGARLLPATSRWVGKTGGLETEFHPPFPVPQGPPPSAADWAGRIAGWFEAYARAHPGELRLQQIRRLVRAPRLERS